MLRLRRVALLKPSQFHAAARLGAVARPSIKRGLREVLPSSNPGGLGRPPRLRIGSARPPRVRQGSLAQSCMLLTLVLNRRDTAGT